MPATTRQWMLLARSVALAAVTFIAAGAAGVAAAAPDARSRELEPDLAALAGAAFTFSFNDALPARSASLDLFDVNEHDAAPGDAGVIALLSTQDDPAAPSSGASPPGAAATQPSPAANNPFLVRDSRRWQVTLGLASDFNDDHLGLGGMSFSYFFEHDLTIELEFNGLFIAQDPGQDTVGFNVAMLLRWHFIIDKEPPHRWSLYADAGFGLAFLGRDVPDDGSRFNFTPQIGVGFSWLVDEANDTRLLAGVRWHHLSNANLFEDNPGSDRLMLYAGLNFPF